jgi:hypothetical protein
MDELGLETEEYQRLLYRATGDITTDIFDRKVIRGLFQQTVDDLKSWFSENGPDIAFKAAIFILVMFFFWILASITGRVVKRAVSASKLNLSHLLQEMLISIASRLVMILGLLMALSQGRCFPDTTPRRPRRRRIHHRVCLAGHPGEFCLRCHDSYVPAL